MIANLAEDERDEAERNKATGFNIFMAAQIETWQMVSEAFVK